MYPGSARPENIKPGVVKIEPRAGGWFFVQIGRARFTKRFNLRDHEAKQLVEQLSALLGESAVT